MDTNIYYLSIQTVSLVDYFAQALILPARFYKNRPSDIQSRKDDYIVLSKNKFLNESNCSINLILTDEEVSSFLQEEKSIFLYKKPIPISRIQKIYFKNKEQKTTTIFNIEKTKTAFIPESLIEIIEEESINTNIINENTFKYSDELESKIKTFNQVLGGIAFVRYTYKAEYSEKYFSILSHFNKYIYNLHTEKKDVFKGYDGAFTYKGKVWDKLSPLIYEYIGDDDVERQSKEENISIIQPLGVFKYEQLENINSLTYKLAILSTYGEDNRKRKKTNDLIFDCKNEKIPKEKQEGIALIFGINNGYSSFRNQYDKKVVKFKMDSLLDYYTIESVFQYVINDNKDSDKFQYIDELFPDEKLVLDIGKKAFDLEEYSTNIFKYFTKNILNISPKELLNHIINQFKNTFIEEMNKKDNILNKKLRNKEKELEQQREIADRDRNELEKAIQTKNSELQREKNIIEDLKSKNIDKDKKIDSLNQILEKKNNELKEQREIADRDRNELEKAIKTKDNELQREKNNFDEEKERIIIEQTLETYLKYDSKKTPELRKIAKEKGIKYTNKSETIKLILAHKNDKLL